MVGLDGYLLGLAEIVLLLHLNLIVARLEHLKGVDTVIHVIGIAGVERIVLHVEENDGGIAHRFAVIVAKHDEVVDDAWQTVVADIAGNTALVEEAIAEVVVGAEREVPAFHPAVVVVHEAVGLGDIVVE